jgi:exonuclease VII large subunit
MKVLDRGYAIVTNKEGQSVSHLGQVHAGEALKVTVSDGDFSVTVEE